MSDNFYKENKREIEAYAKWLFESVARRDEKSDSNTEAIEFTEAYRHKANLIANTLIEFTKGQYESLTPFAIRNLGKSFLSIIQNEREKDANKIEIDVDTIMNFLGQASQEVLLRRETTPNIHIANILEYFYHSELRTDEEKVLSVYLTGKLPLLVYADFTSNQSNSLSKEIKEAERKVDSWNEKLNNIEALREKVDDLRKNLESQKTSFNFLGLSAAFRQFHNEKQKSLLISLGFLLFFGVLILAIPAATLATFYPPAAGIGNTNSTTSENTASSAKQRNVSQQNTPEYPTEPKINNIIDITIHALPIFAIEIILLFYFRISLNNFNSTKSQIMQLQMRNAICQFIEPYVKFKEDHKELRESLDRFESQVFSSLAPNDESMPSTFDGIEQLGKLIKTIRN